MDITCKKGHVFEPDSKGKCKQCNRDYRSARYLLTKDAHLARIRKYRQRHPDRVKEQDLKFDGNNPVYCIWKGMVHRCHNPKDPSYDRYGGKGVTVFEGWRGKEGHRKFEAYMGPRPTLAHTVDRIKNERGYEPGNVKWATKEEQASNRRTTVFITLAGRTQSRSQWARELGITPHAMAERMKRGGTEEQMLKPKHGKGCATTTDLMKIAIRQLLGMVGDEPFDGRHEIESLL